MSSYPSALDSFTTFVGNVSLQGNNHTAQSNQANQAIVALETKLGMGSSTPTNNTILRGNGTGTTDYDQLHLGTDVSGILQTQNGGTGTTGTTGTGSNVLNSSPNLITPVTTGLGNTGGFTNTNGIANSGGISNTGGITTDILNVLNSLNLPSGSITFADLLSTIFSGQVQSQTNAGTAGGTMWWINLGGIKILWGTSAAQVLTSGGPQFSVTFPTFFNSIQAANVSLNSVNTVSEQSVNWASISTTGGNLVGYSVNTTTGEPLGYIVIGT